MYTDTQPVVVVTQTTAELDRLEALGNPTKTYQSGTYQLKIKLFKSNGKPTFNIAVKSMEEVGHILYPRPENLTQLQAVTKGNISDFVFASSSRVDIVLGL